MAPPVETPSLLFRQPPAVVVVGFLTALVILYPIATVIYNVYFHPLARFPGPKTYGASWLAHGRDVFSGRPHKRLLALHEEYGPIVRIAPNELSFMHNDAWKDITGHRKAGRGENEKDQAVQFELAHGILGAGRESHARQRKVLSHAFSAQAMVAQQPLIKSYIDLLLRRLHENCQGGTKSLNMVSWYNWTTFDVIGDLTFGESFDCLKKNEYHSWISIIWDSLKSRAMMRVVVRWPLLYRLAHLAVPRDIRYKAQEHVNLTKIKVDKRLSLGSPRPDFMECMITGDKKLSRDEIDANCNLLIIAGSETTATTLSGVTYLITTHPPVMNKLTEEIRSSFQSEDQIDLLSVQKLEYMLAVLNEAMRIYPAAPAISERLVAKGGDLICGEFIPDGTILFLGQYPAYHSAKNFTLPQSFIPERWLGDSRFEGDKKDVFQPFSTGPRNCLGKNLAYAEMRLILARVLWNFDLKLAEESKKWLDQDVYALWDKPPLQVYLTPRKLA